MSAFINKIPEFTHRLTRPKGTRPNRTTPICFVQIRPVLWFQINRKMLSADDTVDLLPKSIQIQFAR
jgi:hypothetical protein